LNPFVDWAFKYIFAREESKSITMGFLNYIIKPENEITEIEFLPNESIPDSEEMKRSVFDILCKDSAGNRFLVEMQNAETKFFDNRMIYYTCRLVDTMGKHDEDWEYDIQKVYTICLMNYLSGDSPRLRTDIALYDLSRQRIFSDRINIIMFQIPCVKAKTIEEASEIYEKLLYLLVSMQKGKTKEQLEMEIINDNSLADYTIKLFKELMAVTDYASLSEAERAIYDAKLKVARDNASCLSFARKSGIEEGREEGRAEGITEGIAKEKLSVAKAMKAKQLDILLISECTGLSPEEIEKL